MFATDMIYIYIYYIYRTYTERSTVKGVKSNTTDTGKNGGSKMLKSFFFKRDSNGRVFFRQNGPDSFANGRSGNGSLGMADGCSHNGHPDGFIDVFLFEFNDGFP